MIEPSKLDDFLNERNLADIEDEIEVIVDLDSTHHSDERKNRDSSNPITDEEIIDLAERSVPKVSKMLMFDKIDVGDKIHLRDMSGNDLNAICALKESDGKLKMVVVTVMKKSRFLAGKGTPTIGVY